VTPLSDALTAAQRSALAALEKAYVASLTGNDPERADREARERTEGAESPREGTEA
jgi:hypothetical protein